MKKLRGNSRKYNQFIAAVLLAVYGFIITPTVFWHQHATDKSSSVGVAFSPQEFSSGTASSFSEDCAVCAHHYAVYTHDVLSVLPVPQSLVSGTDDFFISRLFSQPLLSHTNKGPPARG